MNELNDFIKDKIQRIFNFQKKIEICKKYPATLFSKDNSDLPADIEADWLRYIEEFEDKFKNAIQIPVFEFVGKPIIKPINAIPLNKLENESCKEEKESSWKMIPGGKLSSPSSRKRIHFYW